MDFGAKQQGLQGFFSISFRLRNKGRDDWNHVCKFLVSWSIFWSRRMYFWLVGPGVCNQFQICFLVSSIERKRAPMDSTLASLWLRPSSTISLLSLYSTVA